MATTPETDLRQLSDRVHALQRAVYYLVWRRTGFGEQCIHCGKAYPEHEEKCKGADIERLVR
jgi:hypothetical protein